MYVTLPNYVHKVKTKIDLKKQTDQAAMVSRRVPFASPSPDALPMD